MSERSAPNTQSPVPELKVAGHQMVLDPGIYCVFNEPGGPLPALDSGLPVVRISPGLGSKAGMVEISGFDPNGWILPNQATLVRILDASASLLVTVYQSAAAGAEPPKLQVVQISGPPGTPAPAPVNAQLARPAAPQVPQPAVVEPEPVATKSPAPTKPSPIEIVAHIFGRGDVGGVIGDWVGEAGSKRWIEGFALAPVDGIPPTDIEYQAVLGRGWLSPWSEGGQFCGSRAMSLPILGLRVRLRGASAETHTVTLSATFVDGTEIGPVGDGEPCEAPSLAALESFNIAITPAGSAPRKPAIAPQNAATAPKNAAIGGQIAAIPPAPKRKTTPKPAAKTAAPVAPKAAAKAPAKPAPAPAAPTRPASRPASTARGKPAPTPKRRR